MNLNQHPTLDQLCKLVASVDDDRYSHILFVTKDGEVHLPPLRADTANEDILQFVLDSFMISKGYLGWQAAQDPEWMDELFSELNAHWVEKTIGFAWQSI
ncbi:hypothetical protein [Salmonirosea aquatica]|uniref:Uncharacterized protein n=1 Tax=Salmonirosea aquatica TaxID=2654236 RepID=A0A7C9BK48_9BACT|nr:hypothetical protein [Cytophagaceae bacterium SJW1-29]